MYTECFNCYRNAKLFVYDLHVLLQLYTSRKGNDDDDDERLPISQSTCRAVTESVSYCFCVFCTMNRSSINISL